MGAHISTSTTFSSNFVVKSTEIDSGVVDLSGYHVVVSLSPAADKNLKFSILLQVRFGRPHIPRHSLEGELVDDTTLTIYYPWPLRLYTPE